MFNVTWLTTCFDMILFLKGLWKKSAHTNPFHLRDSTQRCKNKQSILVFESSRCPSSVCVCGGGTYGAPSIVFPCVWREGPGPGQIPDRAVQGLESTAASEKTCLFSRKNVLQIVSKNSARWDFPVWHSFDYYDQEQREPIHLHPSPEPPVESQPLWDPCSYCGLQTLLALDNLGKIRLLSNCWLLPGCLPFPWQRKNGLLGRRHKAWLQGMVSTAFTYPQYPWSCQARCCLNWPVNLREQLR